MIVHVLKHAAAWIAFLTVLVTSGNPETVVPAIILFAMAYLIGRPSRPEEEVFRFKSETTEIVFDGKFGSRPDNQDCS